MGEKQQFLKFVGVGIAMFITPHPHPGYEMINWWLAVYPLNLHYIFLIFPNKSLIIASLISVLLKVKIRKKYKLALTVVSAIACIANLRLHATIWRFVGQCHSPLCLYPIEQNLIIALFFLMIIAIPTLETEDELERVRIKKALNYLYCYGFILIFWHFSLVNFSIFLVNLIYFKFYYKDDGNLRIHRFTRLRKIFGD